MKRARPRSRPASRARAGLLICWLVAAPLSIALPASPSGADAPRLKPAAPDTAQLTTRGSANLDEIKLSDAVDTELFSIDATSIALRAGIGHRVTASATFAAKRDVRVLSRATPEEPTPEFGASLGGSCPQAGQLVDLRAGDTCSLKVRFEPAGERSVHSTKWDFSVWELAPSGATTGEEVSRSVLANASTASPEFSDIAAGEVQRWRSGSASLQIINPGDTEITVKPAEIYDIRLVSDSDREIVVAPNSIASIEYLFSPTEVGEVHERLTHLVETVASDGAGATKPTTLHITKYASGTCVLPFLLTKHAYLGDLELGGTSSSFFAITNTSPEPIDVEWELYVEGDIEDVQVGLIPNHIPAYTTIEVPVTWTPSPDMDAFEHVGWVIFTPTGPHADTVAPAYAFFWGSFWGPCWSLDPDRPPCDPTPPQGPGPGTPEDPLDPPAPEDPTGSGGVGGSGVADGKDPASPAHPPGQAAAPAGPSGSAGSATAGAQAGRSGLARTGSETGTGPLAPWPLALGLLGAGCLLAGSRLGRSLARRD